MNTGRLELADAAYAERCFVRDGCLAECPQAPSDKIIVGTDRPLREPEVPRSAPDPVAPVDVELLVRIGVSDLEGLGGREVATLGRRRARRGAGGGPGGRLAWDDPIRMRRCVTNVTKNFYFEKGSGSVELLLECSDGRPQLVGPSEALGYLTR